MEWLESHWDCPDEGLWEVRGERRHFTHWKLMCWAAFARAEFNDLTLEYSLNENDGT